MRVRKVDKRMTATSPTAVGGTFIIRLGSPRVALNDASVSSVQILVRKEGEDTERGLLAVSVLNSNTLQAPLDPSVFGVNSTDGYNDEGLYQLSVLVQYTDGSQDVYEVEERLQIIDTLKEDAR